MNIDEEKTYALADVQDTARNLMGALYESRVVFSDPEIRNLARDVSSIINRLDRYCVDCRFKRGATIYLDNGWRCAECATARKEKHDEDKRS